jgi:hypothetical protein
MQVAVWDTYVTKKDGSVMHFDIIVPAVITDPDQVYQYGHTYLQSRNQEGQTLHAKECSFCHIETVRPAWEEAIKSQGYFIYEMENCK